MTKLCLMEIDLGVICACMPSMPVLFRYLGTAIKNRNQVSTSNAIWYSGPGKPFSPAWGSGKDSAVISSFPSSRRPEGSRVEHVEMTTTINQTFWQDHSDDNIPLRNDSLPLESQQFDMRKPSKAGASAEAWAGQTGQEARTEV